MAARSVALAAGVVHVGSSAVAIERRGNGVYYYTYRRVRGRVIKEYGGHGYTAILAARLDTANRESRKLVQRSQKIDRDLANADLFCDREWFARIDRIVAVALELSGWHSVNRQWRKKRGTSMNISTANPLLSWDSDELIAAVGKPDKETQERAKAGDQAATAAIKEYLAHPAAKALYGDIGRHALNAWVKLCARENVAIHQGLIRFACDLRAALTGPNGGVLEQLVAERVVLAWLFVNWAESTFSGTANEQTRSECTFQLRRMELADRRLMNACRTLAKVRRMKLPEVLALVNVEAPAA